MPQRELAVIRSFMFTPANHPRRVEKVFQIGADAVILDLEDAVAVAEKVGARDDVVAAFSGSQRDCLHYVRINSVETEFWRDDIQATVGSWLDGIVVPKVESAVALLEVERAIAEAEDKAGLAAGCLDILPIIETAKGVEAAAEIATAGSRVRRFAFGGGDYTLDLDYEWSADEDVLAYARARLSHASRLGGLLPPIDTVVLQINDDARFTASAQRGRKFGFGGKLCIHPSQVPLTNAIFSPSAEEIAHATAVVAAFEAAEASGSASIQLDGYFIDYPIVYKSQRILALAALLNEPRVS
ncbi:HpcH/HpaI aldolase/citrate lyase family protein [Luminiphilus sp. nBUS_07]|uniref:HpcH/HpaI aldolase/citrate lyase family protein n=1 Tax=Luminiphilus sp. nBUS_07 TaxID=3395314 RepID=UPI003EB88611